MAVVERVTVAVNGGPASAAALEWAIDRAKDGGVRLELITVIEPDLGITEEAESDYRDGYSKVLEDAKSAATSSVPGLEVTTKSLFGLPHEALLGASQHTDILVIGAKKTSLVAGLVHGTLPLKLAGQAECVTVVVPVGWQPNRGDVVVGWNDDSTAEEALDFGAHEASQRQRGLTIVHTQDSLATDDPAFASLALEDLTAENRSLLADAASRTQLARPTLQVTQILHTGSAAAAIVRASFHASLVVVGSRGRGVIAGFFLGSVSHDVLLSMPAPVAVVPRRIAPR